MSTTATTTDPAAPANSRAHAMAQGRQADSARRRQRVLAALNRATATGVEISVSGIARAAGVDRTFLYRHRDLLAQAPRLGGHPASHRRPRRSDRHPGLTAGRPARRPRTSRPAQQPRPAPRKAPVPSTWRASLA